MIVGEAKNAPEVLIIQNSGHFMQEFGFPQITEKNFIFLYKAPTKNQMLFAKKHFKLIIVGYKMPVPEVCKDKDRFDKKWEGHDLSWYVVFWMDQFTKRSAFKKFMVDNLQTPSWVAPAGIKRLKL